MNESDIEQILSELESDNLISIPDDVETAEDFVEWVRSLNQITMPL